MSRPYVPESSSVRQAGASVISAERGAGQVAPPRSRKAYIFQPGLPGPRPQAYAAAAGPRPAALAATSGEGAHTPRRKGPKQLRVWRSTRPDRGGRLGALPRPQ